MPRFIIHIGPAKTGSKYLQSTLFGLRAEMLKDGIDYADCWWSVRRPHISHAPLMERLQGPPDTETEAAFRRLRESDCRSVILSCEGFTALPLEKLEYWRSLLGDSPAEIVFYCRRWSERIPSSWQQDVKEGRFETLPELCVRTFRKPLENRGINYTLVWEKYAAAFGKENLRLISYSNLRDQNVDIARHFLSEVVKWRDDVVLPTENIVTNVSPGAFHIETLRGLNYLHFAKTGKPDFRVRVKYFQRENLAPGTRSAGVRAAASSEAPRLNPLNEAMQQNLSKLRIDDRTVLFDEVYHAVSKYRDCLIGTQYGADIFRRAPVDFDWVRPDYLLWPGVMEYLQELYATLDVPRSDPRRL